MFILGFLFSSIALVTSTLPRDPTWYGEGLDVCNKKACMDDAIAGTWIDFDTAIENIPTVCTNLVGKDGELAYVGDERRLTCIQMANGDNSYKWDFGVWRNKCSQNFTTLDYHSCADTYTKIMDGRIDWCFNTPGTASFVIGGHQQVGCFDVYSSAQPGLCAGTLPIGPL